MQDPPFTPMRRTSVRSTASRASMISSIGTHSHSVKGSKRHSEDRNLNHIRRMRQAKRVADAEESVIDAHLLEFDSEMESDADSDQDDFLMTGRHLSHDPRRDAFISNSVYFKGVVGAMILFNTIVIALEALYIEQQYVFFDYLELFFTFFYVFEIGWRIWERGMLSFLTNDDWWWSWFDLLITGVSLADTFMGAQNGKSAGASVGRLFRVFRILRMFRAMKFMNEVDYVLAHAAKATFKLALVVMLVLFVASIIATNMLWDCPDPVVADMFGDLTRSLWSMFKLMTLDDWVPVSERVIKVRPGMILFFVVFIFSTSIALISLVPAIFIEISLNSREREDAFHREREQRQRRHQKTRLLRTLFKLTDRNGNGKISVEEMKMVLTNDSYLRQLQAAGLTEAGDLRDVRLGLFDLWEEAFEETASKTYEITEDDFIDGLNRMREDVSQAVVWRSTTATRLMLRDFSSFVRKELREIRYNTGHLEKEMKEIINSARTEIINLKAYIADASTSEAGKVGVTVTGASARSSMPHRGFASQLRTRGSSDTLSDKILGGPTARDLFSSSREFSFNSMNSTGGAPTIGQSKTFTSLNESLAEEQPAATLQESPRGQMRQGSGDDQIATLGLSPRAGSGGGTQLGRVSEQVEAGSTESAESTDGISQSSSPRHQPASGADAPMGKTVSISTAEGMFDLDSPRFVANERRYKL